MIIQVSRARADLIHLRETRILGPAAGPGGSEIVHLLRPAKQHPLAAAIAAGEVAAVATAGTAEGAACSSKILVQVVCFRLHFTPQPILLYSRSLL